MNDKVAILKYIILAWILISPFDMHAQNKIRSVVELTADTSGSTVLFNMIKTSKNKVIIFQADKIKAEEALLQTQVTTRSLMGAVVYFTVGLLIDNGWIHLLGSGNKKMQRTLPSWNKGKTFKEYGETPSYLLIGDDAIGGLFALNGGGLGNELGKVYYLAPETLQWESMQRGYSDFVDFCLNGDLSLFYKNYRWKGWESDTSKLSGDQIFGFYPFLWTKEGKDITKTKRNVLPIQEHYDFITSLENKSNR